MLIVIKRVFWSYHSVEKNLNLFLKDLFVVIFCIFLFCCRFSIECQIDFNCTFVAEQWHHQVWPWFQCYYIFHTALTDLIMKIQYLLACFQDSYLFSIIFLSLLAISYNSIFHFNNFVPHTSSIH